MSNFRDYVKKEANKRVPLYTECLGVIPNLSNQLYFDCSVVHNEKDKKFAVVVNPIRLRDPLLGKRRERMDSIEEDKKDSSSDPEDEEIGKQRKIFDSYHVYSAGFKKKQAPKSLLYRLNIDLKLEGASAKKLSSYTLARYKSDLELLLKQWPIYFEAIDVYSMILQRLLFENSSLFRLISDDLLDRFKNCLKVFKRLNETLNFGSVSNVLQRKFLDDTDFALPTKTNIKDGLVASKLEENIQFYEKVDTCETKTAITTTNSTERVKRYREQEKITTLVLNNATPSQIETVVGFVNKKPKVKQTYTNGYRIEILHTSDTHSLLKRRGNLAALCREIGYPFEEVVISHQDASLENKRDYNVSPALRVIYTLCRHLVRRGCLLPGQAQSALLMAWKSMDGYELIKSSYSRFTDMRTEFLQENLRTKVIANNNNNGSMDCLGECIRKFSCDEPHIEVFYLNAVADIVKDGNYDMLFVDGTHVKSEHFTQLLLARFYSSTSKRIINGAYALTKNKNTEAYLLFLTQLKAAKMLDNIKVCMSDFERALSGALVKTIPNVTSCFCLFHLLSATRKYAGAINKAITHLKLPDVKPTTVKIHYIFSYIMFVDPDKFMGVFTLLFKHVWKGTLSVADYIFARYFYQTYCVLYKINKIDLETYPFLTNNTVEGVNSGIKRIIKNMNNQFGMENWIVEDVKKTILRYEKPKNFAVPRTTLNVCKAKTDFEWLQCLIIKLEESKPNRKARQPEHANLLTSLKQINDLSFDKSLVKYVVGNTTLSSTVVTVENAKPTFKDAQIKSISSMIS